MPQGAELEALKLINAGISALAEYVALHVLTCLVPAFLIAGAIMAMVNKEVLLSYLGTSASKLKSFPVAIFSSFLLAVCSCTVIPIASGIYHKTRATSTAMIILWTAPAANILALVYTGAILGVEMALARLLTAILTSFVIGITLFVIFDKKIASEERVSFSGKILEKRAVYLLLLLIISLLIPNYLGVGRSYEFKVAIFAPLIALALAYAFRAFEKEELKLWFMETWFFVKQIIPLLLIGVFVVGVVGELLKETELVSTYLGGEGLQQSFLASIIGALSYFATLTEAPFVKMLMELGMGKGAAIALLLAGPGISLPNMLAIAKLFGVRRAAVYVSLIVLLAALAGWFLGVIVWR
jgi:uncharacterized membrane protein YraQ (UPF0718 family)